MDRLRAIRPDPDVAPMANTLGNYVATIYSNQFLQILTKRLGLANRVTRAFDLDRTVDRGDTIKIVRPAKIAASAMPASASNLVPDNVTISMSRWYGNVIAITDKEYSQANAGMVPAQLPALAYGVADQIDGDIASLITTVPHVWAVDALGAPSVEVSDVLGVQRKQIDLQVDVEDTANMFFMIGGMENQQLLNPAGTGGGLAGWNQSGPIAQQTVATGQIGFRYGYNFFVNQNRPTLPGYANITDFAGAVAASVVAKGATTISVASLGAAETYNKGTIIRFTSGSESGNEYAITANALMSGGANAAVTINPGLRVGLAGSETFSIAQTQGEATQNQDNISTVNENVAFHRGWAALAMGRLPDYAEFPGMQMVGVSSIQDPVTGLAVRIRIGYDFANAALLVGCDALWGFAELNADMACRMEVLAA